MGWAVQDTLIVEDAKVELSRVKAATYLLWQKVHAIQHKEKGPELKRLVTTIQNNLDEVEIHLNR